MPRTRRQHHANPGEPPQISTLPGCTPEERARAYQKREAIRSARQTDDARTTSPEAKSGALETLVKELWASPCLAHVRRFHDLPSVATVSEFDAFVHGFEQSLLIGGFAEREAARVYVLPVEPARGLDPVERRKLAPWTCAKADEPT